MSDLALACVIAFAMLITHLGFGLVVWLFMERMYGHRMTFLDHAITCREQWIRQMCRDMRLHTDVPPPVTHSASEADKKSVRDVLNAALQESQEEVAPIGPPASVTHARRGYAPA